MTLGLIFKRIAREWRLLSILLFAICLITGFFSLGPLYIRTVTEVDLLYALTNADPEELTIQINSTQALTTEDQDLIEQEVGALATGVERFLRSDYSPPIAASGQEPSVAGTAVCGFNFSLGVNPLQFFPGSSNHCYQPQAYEGLADKVRVVEGRLPERGPTPDMVDSTGMSTGLQDELEVGIYSRYEVEAVVTPEVAETANLELGSRFFIGNLIPTESALTRVIIVGIVEPINPDEPYWSAMFINGALVEINNLGQTRYDFGLVFHPDAYHDWVDPVLPAGVDTNYFWSISIDKSIINSQNAELFRDKIGNLGNSLSTNNRLVNVNSGLQSLLAGYENRVSDAQGPIILLSGAVLILMLYHLITTVSLVLQQQGREWSTISSRGGSTFQLFKLQAVTIFILAAIAAIVGPLLSRIFMMFLEVSGPLAEALDGVELGSVSIPEESLQLSLAAAIAALVVLTLPSIPAAKESLLRLKQATSRPPTNPAWAKYFLDFILIIVGIVAFLRMYWIASEDDVPLGELLGNLVEDPASVIKFVADNVTEAGGLSDPFNLMAPALVLTGVALFWLRLFPMLVGLISRITSRSNMLATPMAVWNVERNPGHYAQLVLLLIGTLALGTASLGLQRTRDVGGWNASLLQTGGAVRADVDVSISQFENTDWERLDGVNGAVPVLNEVGDPTASTQGNITVLGIDPEAFVEAFPDFAEEVSALQNVAIDPSGLELPADASQIQVQAWSSSVINTTDEDYDPAIDPIVIINAYVQDANGVPYRIQMTQEVGSDASGQQTSVLPPTPTDQWVTLSGTMPSTAVLPLRLYRLGVKSSMPNVDFGHTVYLDYWQTVDVNGTATPVGEQEIGTLWEQSPAEIPYPPEWSLGNISRDLLVDSFQFVETLPNATAIFDGQNALQVDYTRVHVRNNEPSLSVNVVTLPRVPAVVSEQFTDTFSAGNNARDLKVGDVRDLGVNFDSGNVVIGIEIVNVINEFPTQYIEGDIQTDLGLSFIIVPYRSTQITLNQALLNRSSRANVAGANQIWFALEDRKPSDELKSQLENMESVTGVTYAWDRFSEILREPLPSGVAGMLFAGFWVSFTLSLLDFAFYIAVTAKQRSFTFGVLRSLGWDANNIWRMLLVEQITLVIPALIVGSLLGAALAYLLLPFLSLVGGATLSIPMLDLLVLILTLVGGFVALLVFTALWLRQMSVNQVLRLGEE